MDFLAMVRRICITLIVLMASFACAAASGGKEMRQFEKRTVLYKGETALGGSILYAGFGSDNSEYFLIANSLCGNGKLFRVSPAFYTAYRDNAAIGCRLAFSDAAINLDRTSLSFLSDDLALDLENVGTRLNAFTAGLFHRNYIGLDKAGTVGLFCEFQLSYSYNRISTLSAGSFNDGQSVQLTFSPGVILYILPVVSLEASAGIANLGYIWSRTVQDGQCKGTLAKGSAALKLNILDCNFGISYHF